MLLRLFGRLVLLLVLAAVAAWGYVAFQIVRFGQLSSHQTADAAVVLGAAAWGNRPSPVYRERIEKAIQLYATHQVRWIILTGGSPVEGYPSEAQVGRRFCLTHGVPDDALLVEDLSRTTFENLQNAREQMAARNIRKVLLVSDPLHMKRSVALAKSLDMDAQPAPTQTSRFRTWQTRAVLLWHETWLYLAFRLFGVVG